MTHSSKANAIVIERTAHPAPVASRGVCVAAATLGVLLDDLAIVPVPRTLTLPWRDRQIITIVGPSGCGKSTLLRDITAAARKSNQLIITPPRTLPRRPVIDALGDSPHDSMVRLARSGLGDMRAFVRRPRELSEGQRARLRIAMMMRTAEIKHPRHAPLVVLIDEYGAGLDVPTTDALGVLLRRWIDRFSTNRPLRLVVASTEKSSVKALAPARTVVMDAAGCATIGRISKRNSARQVRIRRGTFADLAALAPLHYRKGHPATVAQVLVIKVDGTRAGVLAVSLPTLNASWRNLAWPGRFTTGDRKTDALRVNRELRCISRVIIEPAYRSLGLAQRLVEYYLSHPITKRTEALAAMGHAAPFFASAGMKEYHTPPTKRHARLLDAFAHLDIEPWRLATPQLVVERLRAADRIEITCKQSHIGPSMRFIERELRLWARRSRASINHAHDDVEQLITHAARAIVMRPVAYAHTHH